MHLPMAVSQMMSNVHNVNKGHMSIGDLASYSHVGLLNKQQQQQIILIDLAASFMQNAAELSCMLIDGV